LTLQLGIDFGTTRTVVAARDRGNFPVVGFEAPDGSVVDHWPTVVATDGTRVTFGWEAISHLSDRRWTVVRSIKRLLAGAGPDQRLALGPLVFTLPDLLGEFLRALRRDILERSNLPTPHRPGEPVEAWVAVPAGSNSSQRFLTLDAFRSAGFSVAGVLNEPSAAGLEYAHRYRKTLTHQREDVLVYDLGGGTFDVSLVHMAEGAHVVRDHGGENHLGGDDFDQVLLDMVLTQVGRAPSSVPRAERTRLLEQCRLHKERLNPNSRRITVEFEDGTNGTVTCTDYYDACLPLVERSLDAVGRVLAAGTGDERFDCDSLAGVYVVGGASDLPVVARRLREVFGRRVKRSAYPSAATAVGLAIAFEDDAPSVSDRFNRTFGVFRESGDGSDVAFDAIVGTDAPVVDGGTALVRRYRPMHNLGCYRFAECDRLEEGVPVGDLLPLGVVRFAFDASLRELSDLEPVKVRRLEVPGPLIEERYLIDGSGLVEIHITDLDSGYSRHHRLGAAIAAAK
jgi:molecular chaperone DnaK (HSP70)